MTVAVLGSNGFIGKHLCAYFKGIGARVIGADISRESTSPEVDQYFQVSKFEPDYAPIFAEGFIHHCINASGAADVLGSVLNPLNDFRSNVVNNLLLLECVRVHAFECRILNLSSAAVYGNPHQLPVAETFPCNPISPYGWHKLQSEINFQEYAQSFNLRTCNARIFSVYGPGLRRQLFWDLWLKARSGGPIQLDGSGAESRDFIFISDLCVAINCIMRASDYRGECVNVANGEEISIATAAETFVEVSRKDTRVKFSGTNRAQDPLRWRANISILKSLGYDRNVTFKDGIEKYLTWLNEIESV